MHQDTDDQAKTSRDKRTTVQTGCSSYGSHNMTETVEGPLASIEKNEEGVVQAVQTF